MVYHGTTLCNYGISINNIPGMLFLIKKYYTPFPNLPEIWLVEKSVGTACFRVWYRACLSSANLNALLFKVDFPLSNS